MGTKKKISLKFPKIFTELLYLKILLWKNNLYFSSHQFSCTYPNLNTFQVPLVINSTNLTKKFPLQPLDGAIWYQIIYIQGRLSAKRKRWYSTNFTQFPFLYPDKRKWFVNNSNNTIWIVWLKLQRSY